MTQVSGAGRGAVQPGDPFLGIREAATRGAAQHRPASVPAAGAAQMREGLDLLRARSARVVTARRQEIARSPVRPQEVDPVEVTGVVERARQALPEVSERLRAGPRTAYAPVVGGVLDVRG